MQRLSKKKTGFEYLSDSWKDQYSPRSFIEDEWFNILNNRIEKEELKTMLKTLPNNKAAGPSGIKNEMLKNLGEEGIGVLTELFNLFLTKGTTPKT